MVLVDQSVVVAAELHLEKREVVIAVAGLPEGAAVAWVTNQEYVLEFWKLNCLLCPLSFYSFRLRRVLLCNRKENVLVKPLFMPSTRCKKHINAMYLCQLDLLHQYKCLYNKYDFSFDV